MILKFYSKNCGPCKMLDKLLDKVEVKSPIVHIDIEESPEDIERWGIKRVPTMVFVNSDNAEVGRHEGAVLTTVQLQSILDNYL